jgi:hypothetical protein
MNQEGAQTNKGNHKSIEYESTHFIKLDLLHI